MTKKVDEKTVIIYPCARPALVIRSSSTSAAQKAAKARAAKARNKLLADKSANASASASPWK